VATPVAPILAAASAWALAGCNADAPGPSPAAAEAADGPRAAIEAPARPTAIDVRARPAAIDSPPRPAASSGASGRPAAAVDAARMLAAHDEPGQWLSYGRTYDEQRFSPLDQITTESVGRLGLAWYADIPLNRGQEATPIVVDGVIYLGSSWSNVFAYDAATGRELWRYDPEVPRQWAVNVCCGVVNRGVAAWNGRIYVGTLDGRLVALDAATGEEVWDVSTIDRTHRYSTTGAVRVVKGRVIVGNSGAEFGVRGYVSAYDAETGELAWRFYTVPGNPADGFENEAMAMAAATWSGEWWRLGGGGTVWDAVVYDPVTDLLFVGVGNGSPWNQAIRSPGGGDNLFLASIVALDPDDGSYVWHYQTTPGETWDFTATQPIIVADLDFGAASAADAQAGAQVPGTERRRVVMQAPKNGFFYVLDAATGALISADPFVPVNWASRVDLVTGRPVENPAARFDRTGEPAVVTPTGRGAHNWQPMSFSPRTGLVYFGSRHSAQAYLGDPDFAVSSVGTNTGIVRTFTPALEAEVEALERELFADRGALMGWDPVARQPRWRYVDPRETGNGGTLATAGDLVFAGGGEGELFAYRADTGERLWTFAAHTGVAAGPISYEVGGEQHVAVAAGRGLQPYYQPNYSRLLAFKLGGTAELPPPAEYVAPALDPPPSTAPPEVIARGADLYGQNCVQCHGNRIGTFPDLRTSAALANGELFRAIVLEGALAANGMVSFADALTTADTDAVRAYVITLAIEAKAAEDAGGAAVLEEAEAPDTRDAARDAEPHVN
jgi:PQQ-dependent dehydrogenase (methanol/ethanol family)